MAIFEIGELWFLNPENEPCRYRLILSKKSECQPDMVLTKHTVRKWLGPVIRPGEERIRIPAEEWL